MNREQNLLACIAEEATEVGKVATKALRFSFTEERKAELEQEVRDLVTVYCMLTGRWSVMPNPQKEDLVNFYYKETQRIWKD